jgi:electron transfer flavoprotein beta subunit
MHVLACVKRVPATGGRVTLTDDALAIDTRHLGATVSPHEECAVEEAVRLVERHGGSTVVLTLGPADAEEQLRDALAIGIDRAVLLETDGLEWGPRATADAIVTAIRGQETAFDVLLFGNEAADTADHQVAVHVAHALGLPCVTGVKALEVEGDRGLVHRAGVDGTEVYEVALPAVIAVREGINLPRFASVPGRIKAKRKELDRTPVDRPAEAAETMRLSLPPERGSEVQVLGTGPDAAPAVVDLLQGLGVVPR